jgi:3-phosphoshikimate 1-carboxyvinyltransferase
VPLLYERPYVDITLAWLAGQGIRLQRRGYEHFIIEGGQRYRPFRRVIPADFSSATFFMVAAAVTGGELLLEGLDREDSQGDKAAAEILEQMGCTVAWEAGGMRITGPRGAGGGRVPLAGGSFDLNAMPDALPALAAAACYAVGETRLTNVPQARSKETDRIAVMARELTALGGDCRELPDGLVINGIRAGEGGAPPSGLRGGAARGHGDHRVIMALAAAGLAAREPVIIDDTAAAAVTFPEFFEALAAAGASIDTPRAPGSTTKEGHNGKE